MHFLFFLMEGVLASLSSLEEEPVPLLSEVVGGDALGTTYRRLLLLVIISREEGAG